jgi:hypothetical protein
MAALGLGSCNQLQSANAISGGNFAARSPINCKIHKGRQIRQDCGMNSQPKLIALIAALIASLAFA